MNFQKSSIENSSKTKHFFTRNGPGEKKQKKQKKKKKKNRFGGGERAAAAEIEDGERVAVGGVSEVGSQSEEVLESEEDVQVEEQDSTSLETFQDELGSSAQFKEDSVYVDHLESELMVKETALRELLESEIVLVEFAQHSSDRLKPNPCQTQSCGLPASKRLRITVNMILITDHKPESLLKNLV